MEVKPQPKPKVEPDPVNPAVMVAELARKRQQRMAAQQQGQEPDGTAAVNNGAIKVAPPVSTKPPKAKERKSIQVEPVEESREDKHREDFSTVADSGSNEPRELSWAPKEYIHKGMLNFSFCYLLYKFDNLSGIYSTGVISKSLWCI